jgi:hypothetical protein
MRELVADEQACVVDEHSFCVADEHRACVAVRESSEIFYGRGM